jgi:integrase
MSTSRKATKIRKGSVSLPLYQHPKGWRFSYKDVNGKWRYVTRRDREKALLLGSAKAIEISNGTADLAKLSPDTAHLIRRVLMLGITHADLDTWQAEKQRPALDLSKAVEEFLEVKKANRGRSTRNIHGLSGDLHKLAKQCGKLSLRAVSVTDLELWLASYDAKKAISPRRRKNLRSSAVTFFRWCRKRGYLPDVTTAAEKLESPSIGRKVPATWTPEEMRVMLDACPAEYLSWLVLAGFAGIRQEELIVDPSSDKSPLDWSDFHWPRKVIIIRPETAKTGDRRVVPILPIVRAWLLDASQKEGRVCPIDPPYKARDASRPSVLAGFAELVGPWRRNALRHSFISYRAAQVGLAQTAMEAGNSEGEARRSYNDAKGKDEAKQWFALMPR